MNCNLMNSILPPGLPHFISPHTTIRWLHAVGFRSSEHKKGTLVDGHERPGVVHSREIYTRQPDLKYTKDEEHFLMKGVDKFGHRWKRILSQYPFQEGGTATSLRDKF